MAFAKTALTERLRLGRDGTILLGSLGTLSALAWLSLWLVGRSPYGVLVHHHGLSVPHVAPSLFFLLFVVGWSVMTMAMMLPTIFPLVTLFQTITRQRENRALLVSLVVAGYVLTWVLFGVIVYVAALSGRWLIDSIPWVERNSWLAAAIVLMAGAFQFTSLKYRCLEKCRSPFMFVTEHWRGRNDRSEAFGLGLRHGLFCVGCCWALMLLMFAVGVGNLGWMLVLAVVMTIEKNVRWGRRLSAPLGFALLAWGVAIVGFQIL